MQRKTAIEATELPSVSTSLGLFRATRLLAETRTSRVFVGRVGDGDEDEVVLKLLHPALVTQSVQRDRLAREAALGRELENELFPRVLDAEVSPERCYIAFERLELRSLASMMARLKPTDPPRWQLWCTIAAQVARGLSALHDFADPALAPRGWLHGDVSPGNIHLTRQGAVKLLDLGLVRPVGHLGRGKESTVVSGTAAYLAPERVRGDPVGVSADLFALALILYEATTLRRVFERESEQETLAAIRSYRMVRPPHLCREGYPRELEALLIRALNREPERRFSSAEEMAQALETYIDGNVGRARAGAQLEQWVAKEWYGRTQQ